jgi:hypothetical protein
MTFRARITIALALTLGWGCDYTPDLPPAPPSPQAAASAAPSGAIPVIVVPVPAQTPRPVVPSPVPPDGPFPVGPVRIVATTPAADETITVSRDSSVRTRRPIIDFEFTSPQSLTLDNAHTNIQLLLVGQGFGCLATDLGHAMRLDRDDTVYVANSVARFRTGPWEWRVSPLTCGLGSFHFSTQYVFYAVGPAQPDQAYSGLAEKGWNFEVR